jgi:hypothetical protein
VDFDVKTKDTLQTAMCGNDDFKAQLWLGVSYRYEYTDYLGQRLASVTIMARDCLG